MLRIIPMLLAVVLITGCAVQGRHNASRTFDASRALLNTCDNTGGTFVNLFYDNSQIRTVSVAHVEPSEIFAIRLKPKNDAYNRPGVDYETVDVTISGKAGFPNSAWLTAGPDSYIGTAPDHELVICVPQGTAADRYYYTIDIDQTGSLDPRADVC
jgi:hypothetical protein